MEGAALAAKRKNEAETLAAFNAAAFNGAAFNGSLGKMKKYLPKGPPSRPQSGSQILAHLREFKARGAGMKITKVVN
jgi:hypothetical protein